MTSYPDSAAAGAPPAASRPVAPGPAPSISEIERFQYQFRSTNWVFVLFLVVVAGSFLAAGTLEDWVCAVTIEVAAFYSIFLWARKSVLGMPLMPAFSGLCLVYYGLPFVSGHPVTLEYTPMEKWHSAATVAAVLLVMTTLWAAISRPAPSRERRIRTLLPEKGAIGILMACLVAGIAFQSNFVYYTLAPSSEVYGVLRAVLLTLSLLAIFSLSFLFGAGTLKGTARYAFVILAGIFIAYHAISLYLIGAAQYLLAGAFGYFLGSGRVPWKWLVVILSALTILQAGKADVRYKYSEDGGGVPYSTVFEVMQDWFGTGLANLFVPKPVSDQDPVPLIHRASLIQMLLKTQTEAPETVPYLNGSTYVQIPYLIVPRVIWANRPNTSETLVQLNEHYGLLTREGAESTSIGWGMIAEANANFGFAGCIGLAVLLGVVLGIAQRACGRFPVLSARGMAGLLVMSTLLSMEASMAQVLTILAQSFVPLVLLTWTVMRDGTVDV